MIEDKPVMMSSVPVIKFVFSFPGLLSLYIVLSIERVWIKTYNQTFNGLHYLMPFDAERCPFGYRFFYFCQEVALLQRRMMQRKPLRFRLESKNRFPV